ncbi:ABC transporter ATP-binding protein [Ilumatobacter coccineus]|jgi:multiple sugar transport system ATP-binding protein|uniref:Putative sugar ABC transporter ATP-binding protein n=1 Tax=Ilumatobacter coccineus (strain NBRC 103263 / KCTC 29153 / YM16-304) TaxID=1313172 RepID=A0A6C7E5X0_ILUCY|nr:ABC transporter ATP-binding protein [Ilumatobacter coccineus]BAN00615.1 putative sugar ABC transporter ATP-binding protein [Ilumatobacter coccineus YM16-304]
MAEVRYEAASRIYPGSEIPAVDRLDLHIHDGELLVLVGPSGSGKSTALRMLAGLETVNKGSIFINDVDVTLKPPQDRDIAMVFQNYALYPSMTVAENMGFALKQAGVPKEQRAIQVREAARILDLEPYLDRKPKNLSGGQRQRVAMGRAIVRSPQVFLMDEPLSNLDAKLRVQTRTELADLQARLGVTMVYVTHDQVEAMTMGHRVAVLKDGILQQVDAPRTLYNAPQNRFVAGFIGSPAMNIVDVERDAGALMVGSLTVSLSDAQRAAVAEQPSSSFGVGVRPEHLSLGADGLEGEVVVVEALGSESFLHVKTLHQGEALLLVVREDGQSEVGRGDHVNVSITGPVHLFGDDGERIGD